MIGSRSILTQASPKRILVVDDEEMNRELLAAILESLGHEGVFSDSGEAALQALTPGIDLLLVDAMMPGMDGFSLVERVRGNPDTKDTPIIMVTALCSRSDRLRAVEAGANDFITKPVDRTELRLRCASLLKMKDAQDALKRHHALLEQTIQERTVALQRALEDVTEARQQTYEAQLDTIQRLAIVAEHRDEETAAHIERVSYHCGLLASALGLSSEEAEVVRQGSRMHDVGKIGIPDSILLKPGPLTPEERLAIQEHAAIGSRLLGGSASPLLRAGEVIAWSHHEWWDGSGYPRGLRGEDIPLYGRICAVADVFDALTSKRPYKEALPVAQAREILMTGLGTQFEPLVLDTFIKLLPKMTP